VTVATYLRDFTVFFRSQQLGLEKILGDGVATASQEGYGLWSKVSNLTLKFFLEVQSADF
jgi:hypothetical protein